MVHLSKKTLTVYVDASLVEHVEALVACGHYANTSAVTEAALGLLQSAEKQRDFERQLKRAYEACQAANIPPARGMTAFLETLGDEA